VMAQVRANSKRFYGLVDRDEKREGEDAVVEGEEETKTEEKTENSEVTKEKTEEKKEKLEKRENKKEKPEKRAEKPEKSEKSEKTEKRTKSSRSKQMQVEEEEELPVARKSKKSNKKNNGKAVTIVVEESDEQEGSSEEEILSEEDDVQNAVQNAEKKKVRYACKKCRRLLFDEDDVASHNESEFANKVTKRDEGSVETDLCQMIFTKHVKWAKLSSESVAEEEVEQSEGVPLAESGRLVCPGCSSKLGRWTIHQPVSCTCGMLSPLPSFAVKKKVMDIILPIDPLSGVVEEFTSDEEEKKR